MVFVAAHFGEWLQGCVTQPDGRTEIALVTLLHPLCGVRARKVGQGPLMLEQSRPVLSGDQAARFLTTLGQPAEGHFALDLDLPPGGGAGMSTAARIALARVAGADERALVQACLASEGASDPLMLPDPDCVLWASRRGKVLAQLPPPPKARVLGGFWGLPHRTDPTDAHFAPIDDLVMEWARGPDLARAATLTRENAQRTTALRGPGGDPTAALAREMGAMGWIRAHTGSARGLIFAPDAMPDPAPLIEAGFAEVQSFVTGARA